MSGTPLGDIMSPLQGSPLSRRLLEPTINEMFGPNTKPSRALMEKFHQILEYNDGKRVLHKVGRFLGDRYAHRNRWVRAMRETTVPMRLIDGPIDPNSGAHMAKRYAEVIPNADVVMLADDIGHWPQIEAPDAVLRHFLAHVDRVGWTRLRADANHELRARVSVQSSVGSPADSAAPRSGTGTVSSRCHAPRARVGEERVDDRRGVVDAAASPSTACARDRG